MVPKIGLPGMVVALFGLALTTGSLRAEKPFAEYPQAARESYTKGEDLRGQGKYRDALAAYAEAARHGLDGYAQLYLHEAECHRLLRDHAKVVAAYSRLIEDLGLERSCRTCMLEALRGRAAGHEALGDLERALTDRTMIVLLHEQDLSVRREMKAGELTDLIQETAKAHRDRARFLMDRARWTAARADIERAEELERQTSGKKTEKANAWVRLLNEWDKPVTVEVDGEVHELRPGAEKKWRRTPGSFTYTVREVGIPATSSAKEGEMLTIRIYPPNK
jgi:tetratricopeptide (TPR) repeat protein